MINSKLFEKTSHLSIGALMLLLVAMPASVVAQGSCPGAGTMGAGYGAMGSGSMMGAMGTGQGMMGMDGGGMMGQGMMQNNLGTFESLELTNEQRTLLKKTQNEQRKANWDVMGKIMDEQAQLRDLYAEDAPDPKKVGAAYARIAKLQQQIAEADLTARNRLYEVLTKEQKDQLKEIRRASFSGSAMPGGMMPRR